MSNNEAYQRAQAAWNRDHARTMNTGNRGKSIERMAGAILALSAIPGGVALIDDQVTTVGDNIEGGLIQAGGIIAGSELAALINRHLEGPNHMERGLKDLKTQSRERMKQDGPQAANEWYGHAKRNFVENNTPRDSYSSPAYKFFTKDSVYSGMGALTPRQNLARLTGGLIGTAVAAPIAYEAMKSGELPMQ